MKPSHATILTASAVMALLIGSRPGSADSKTLECQQIQLPSQPLVGGVFFDTARTVTVTLSDVNYNVKTHTVQSTDHRAVFDNRKSAAQSFDFGYVDVSGKPELRKELLVQADVDGSAQACTLIKSTNVWEIAIGRKSKSELPASDLAYARLILYFLDEKHGQARR